MSNVFLDSAQTLQQHALQYEAVLVAFSGGKDSLCVLDLCCKAFRRVECYLMRFVPNLEHEERQLAFAAERYNVKIHRTPHYSLFYNLRHGVYCPPRRQYDDLPDIGPFDVADYMMAETGISLVATGMKRSDSMSRRRIMSNIKGRQNLIHPIADWNKYEVLAYLKLNDIPIPPSDGHATTAAGLAMRQILWLYDQFPDDFAQLERWFPYVRSVVYRRRWFGVRDG